MVAGRRSSRLGLSDKVGTRTNFLNSSGIASIFDLSLARTIACYARIDTNAQHPGARKCASGEARFILGLSAATS